MKGCREKGLPGREGSPSRPHGGMVWMLGRGAFRACGALGQHALPVFLVVATICTASAKDKSAIYSEGGGFDPDRVVDYRDHPKQPLQLHIFHPSGFKSTDRRPVIVFFFGGGWSGSNPKQFYPQSAYFASRGMVTICATYRTTSKYKTEPYDCVADAKSAIQYVRKHSVELGVDPNKLAAGGGSAGGHIAAATATVKRWDHPEDDRTVSGVANALILFNPVFNNGPGGYGNNAKDRRVSEYWQDFSPLHNLDGTQPPTLVLMGSRDKHTPVKITEEYDRRMKANGNRCDTIIYEGQKHGFFNLGKGGKDYFIKTIIATDRFLVSLDYLEGEQTADAWFAEQERR